MQANTIKDYLLLTAKIREHSAREIENPSTETTKILQKLKLLADKISMPNFCLIQLYDTKAYGEIRRLLDTCSPHEISGLLGTQTPKFDNATWLHLVRKTKTTQSSLGLPPYIVQIKQALLETWDIEAFKICLDSQLHHSMHDLLGEILLSCPKPFFNEAISHIQHLLDTQQETQTDLFFLAVRETQAQINLKLFLAWYFSSKNTPFPKLPNLSAHDHLTLSSMKGLGVPALLEARQIIKKS